MAKVADSTNLWGNLSKEAEKSAARRVAELLSKPEHLSFTDQLKTNYTKKKSILEARLELCKNILRNV
jgi:hypothetical protein